MLTRNIRIKFFYSAWFYMVRKTHSYGMNSVFKMTCLKQRNNLINLTATKF